MAFHEQPLCRHDMKKRKEDPGDAKKARVREGAEAYSVSHRRAGVHRTGEVGEIYSAWDLKTAATRVSEGLPVHVLDTIQRRLDLSNSELAHLVLIPPRTLTRRKHEERLPPDESERAYRVARLTEIAAEVLGNEEEAEAWMKEPNFALGEQTPLETARSEPGATLVERLLGQIEHGIPV
ncbi:MAG TPA: antitoxin Xre/MbcA/ParS toxin-binding domain-containing protein [Rhodothermales bacterium]|nr:antitoxin Xre/MbcA/ParS toxin-binding domain-containing protein [Rhodothermales bacterium]